MTFPKAVPLLALLALAVEGCGGSHGTAAKPVLVVIPRSVRQTDLVDAYTILHRLGFRVAMDKPVAISSLTDPGIAGVRPAVGTRLPRGAAVTLEPGFGPIGSPAVLQSHPHYRVPSFVGRPLTAAIAWTEERQMFWSIPRLPALPASTTPMLFDAYRIVAQHPPAGDTLTQGHTSHGGFAVTPLTLTVERR
jgi:beta-lactam-binding protein with PASTA domain